MSGSGWYFRRGTHGGNGWREIGVLFFFVSDVIFLCPLKVIFLEHGWFKEYEVVRGLYNRLLQPEKGGQHFPLWRQGHFQASADCAASHVLDGPPERIFRVLRSFDSLMLSVVLAFDASRHRRIIPIRDCHLWNGE